VNVKPDRVLLLVSETFMPHPCRRWCTIVKSIVAAALTDEIEIGYRTGCFDPMQLRGERLYPGREIHGGLIARTVSYAV
jgi:hypothetical protein